jgi:NADP-dependent 3-hydroxy acid dehydrogenase YdfG
MKIAITGHSAGIGQALAKLYSAQGHEIIGLSRRDGNNIRNIPKIADLIEPCDMFVNNAQSGYAQTELLFEVWTRWQGQPKQIMLISTMMTLSPTATLPGSDMDHYRIQKMALEEACRQLAHKSLHPTITLVRPGAVATQPGQNTADHADVNKWAETLLNVLELSRRNNLSILELSLGPSHG